MSAGVKLAIGAVIITAVTLYMAYVGASSSWKYYVTAEEYLAHPQAFAGQQLRVSGKVADGSLVVPDSRTSGRFALAAGTADAAGTAGLAVECQCVLPDNLAEGVEVVVEGRLNEHGVLRADKVLTRCASKYQASLPARTAAAGTSREVR